MKRATKVKDLPEFNGRAALYKVEPPMAYGKKKKTSYVAVSAVVAMFSGPETYIFPADKKGEVLDWNELGGSFKGGLCHETALTNAGYEVRP